MKREQIAELGLSEEQITNVLNLVHESNNQQTTSYQSEIARLKDFESKYNDVQKQLDEINKSNMTAQEQIEADRKEAEENLRKSQIILNTATAKDILAGYDVDEELIESLVKGDENSTKEKANKLKSLLDSKIEATTLKVREELSSLNAKPSPSNVPNQDDTMSIDKFKKLTMLEQKQWKEAHPDEYRELVSQK